MILALFTRLLRRRPDVDALRAAWAGDAAAIGAVYDAHVDGLYAFVFHRVGRDAAIAEDVVHDTFALAMNKRADYDPGRGSIATWLAVLSRNIIRDHLKAARKPDELQHAWERIDASFAQMFAAMAEQPLPGDVLERAETRDLVHMAVANLPEQYRTVLQRKYIDGERIDTLARELGLSAEATKSLLARARRAFRDTFATLSAHLSEAV